MQTAQDELMAQVRGFMESRIVLTGAELGLYSLLAREPMTAQRICERLNGDLRAVTILLDALAAIGLLDKQNETYRTPENVADLLAEGAPESVVPIAPPSSSGPSSTACTSWGSAGRLLSSNRSRP